MEDDTKDYEAPEVEDAGAEDAPAVTAAGQTMQPDAGADA